MGRVTKPTATDALAQAYGEATRHARKAAGLSLKQAAAAIGVSINTMRWHEAGATIMEPGRVFALARLLHVDRPGVLGVTYRAQAAWDELGEAAIAEGYSSPVVRAGGISLE